MIDVQIHFIQSNMHIQFSVSFSLTFIIKATYQIKEKWVIM